MPKPRSLEQIVAHLRAVAGESSIDTTLIQTQDLEKLCDCAVEGMMFMQHIASANPDTSMQVAIDMARERLVALEAK